MIKLMLSGMLSFTIFMCSAQNQLITYQDLQYLVQNKANAVTSFLKQKDYQTKPAFSNDEARYSVFYADNDYTDIVINTSTKHTTVSLSTTHLPQLEVLEKMLTTYPTKNSKGAKVYRVKDNFISKVAIKEDEPQGKANKIYTIEAEN